MLNWGLKIIKGRQTKKKIEVDVIGLIDLLEEGIFRVDRIVVDREIGKVEYYGEWQPPNKGWKKAVITTIVPENVLNEIDLTYSEIFPPLPWEDWVIDPVMDPAE